MSRLVLHQRDDGVAQTLLRKAATHARDGDVWVDGRTCVPNGELVTVLRREAEFGWVRTGAGVEGYLKLSYLLPPPEEAKVQRHGQGQTTMLRKVATHARDGDVWVDGRTCVPNGELVTVLRREAEFGWVRTGAGVEGYLKLSYLLPPAVAKVQRDDGVAQTLLRKVATHARDGDVWVDGRTCVPNGELVTVLRREAEFGWVRTGAGVEGYLKLAYLAAEEGVPNKLLMFHGTDGANAAGIIQHGLRPSAGGRLGPGVYLTPDQTVANTIAKHRGLQFVLECEVTPGKVYNFDTGTGALPAQKQTWAASGFNAAQSMHPPWAGVDAAFCEYCIHDAAAVRVIKVEGFVAKPT